MRSDWFYNNIYRWFGWTTWSTEIMRFWKICWQISWSRYQSRPSSRTLKQLAPQYLLATSGLESFGKTVCVHSFHNLGIVVSTTLGLIVGENASTMMKHFFFLFICSDWSKNFLNIIIIKELTFLMNEIWAVCTKVLGPNRLS